MEYTDLSRNQMEMELSKCETRLKELVASDRASEYEEDLNALGDELKSCRLELGEIEHRTDDEWEEAKHGVVRRLSEARRNLSLTARKLNYRI